MFISVQYYKIVFSYPQLRQSGDILSTIIFMNFYISLIIAKSCNISKTVWKISKKLTWWRRKSFWGAGLLKNLNFDIQNGGELRLKNRKNAIFYDNAVWVSRACRPPCRHLGSLKLIFFTGCALDRHVLHHREKFCGDRSYCFGDIAIYRVFFLAKCKNSKDDRA